MTSGQAALGFSCCVLLCPVLWIAKRLQFKDVRQNQTGSEEKEKTTALNQTAVEVEYVYYSLVLF